MVRLFSLRRRHGRHHHHRQQQQQQQHGIAQAIHVGDTFIRNEPEVTFGEESVGEIQKANETLVPAHLIVVDDASGEERVVRGTANRHAEQQMVEHREYVPKHSRTSSMQQTSARSLESLQEEPWNAVELHPKLQQAMLDVYQQERELRRYQKQDQPSHSNVVELSATLKTPRVSQQQQQPSRRGTSDSRPLTTKSRGKKKSNTTSNATSSRRSQNQTPSNQTQHCDPATVRKRVPSSSLLSPVPPPICSLLLPSSPNSSPSTPATPTHRPTIFREVSVGSQKAALGRLVDEPVASGGKRMDGWRVEATLPTLPNPPRSLDTDKHVHLKPRTETDTSGIASMSNKEEVGRRRHPGANGENRRNQLPSQQIKSKMDEQPLLSSLRFNTYCPERDRLGTRVEPPNLPRQRTMPSTATTMTNFHIPNGIPQLYSIPHNTNDVTPISRPRVSRRRLGLQDDDDNLSLQPNPCPSVVSSSSATSNTIDSAWF